MALLEWRGLAKSFGNVQAVRGISLSVAEGEILGILGPSGSGKSTLLRLTAGLEQPDSGTVLWEGLDLSGIPPDRRGFGLMFQDYSLFPHLDVAGNVGFGLRSPVWDRRRRAERVREMLSRVRMEGFERRPVHSLSGGEQQRVALARSLAPSPRLLMLDEPLGALDAALGKDLLAELSRLLRELGVTALYVTHDQEEALAVSDRVALLKDGSLVQAGSPRELVERPASSFVAAFLKLGAVIRAQRSSGTPRIPCSSGTPRIPSWKRDGEWFLRTDIGSFPYGSTPRRIPRGDSPAQGSSEREPSDLWLLIRPSAVRLTAGKGTLKARARVLSRSPHPEGTLVRLALLGGDGASHELACLWSDSDERARSFTPSNRARTIWLDPAGLITVRD